VAEPEGAPPQAIMMQMINGKLLSRCVSLVAELAIADHLKNGPQDAGSLAATTSTNPDVLYRVLRMLASLDVFVELPDRQFENSPLSETLRSDVPGSVRHYARWLGTGFHWRTVGDLDYSVRTGKPALAKDEPDKTPFEILSRDRSAQQTFNDAMSGLSLADGTAIVQSYDFSRFGRVIDVGGGQGTLATMIARAAPEARLRVLDLPHVIDGTKKRIEDEGLEDRIEAIAGNFLESVPGPADVCVLKNIIHDWDDEISRRILTNCRNALEDGGCVLVCEILITPGPESIPARLIDIEMLVGPGGRERTEAEFVELFATARLKLNRVIETPTPIRLLEGVNA
jgi:SAM-dependent methyltransferase